MVRTTPLSPTLFGRYNHAALIVVATNLQHSLILEAINLLLPLMSCGGSSEALQPSIHNKTHESTKGGLHGTKRYAYAD